MKYTLAAIALVALSGGWMIWQIPQMPRRDAGVEKEKESDDEDNELQRLNLELERETTRLKRRQMARTLSFQATSQHHTYDYDRLYHPRLTDPLTGLDYLTQCLIRAATGHDTPTVAQDSPPSEIRAAIEAIISERKGDIVSIRAALDDEHHVWRDDIAGWRKANPFRQQLWWYLCHNAP